MQIKKRTLGKTDICKTTKNIASFLAGVLVLVLAVSLDVHAAGKVKADGMLTSIEIDGTVIIDDMGYFLAPALRVHNYEGMPISLRDINLPHSVHFEYEYAPEGFMIIFIKEIAG
jgi:hypothetical protein